MKTRGDSNVAGRNNAALKKRVQTLAAKGDDSMITLAEALSELRDLPRPPDGDPPTLDELVELTKLSRRTIYYLLKVWQMVTDLGIPRDRLVHMSWTKMAVVAENCEPEEVEDAPDLVETFTAEGIARRAEGAITQVQGPYGEAPPYPKAIRPIRGRPARKRRSATEERAGLEKALMKALAR